MKTNISLKVALLFICFFSIYACSVNETSSTPSNPLLDLIASKAPNGDLANMILPKSSDYNSIPQDPKNPISDAKVELGKLLFHESALAINPKNAISIKTYSCASCHNAGAGFQSGIRQGIGDGGEGYGIGGEGRKANAQCLTKNLDIQPLKSPSVLNSAYQKLMLWNGQFGATGDNVGTEVNWFPGSPIANNHLGYEGVEIQAMAGFHVHRMGINKELLDSGTYKALFAQAFPMSQDVNRYTSQKVGLAIAAYERTILANEAPFQKYLMGDKNALTDQQKEGAMLFFEKANCVQCHNGPALNTMEFHALGMGALTGSDVVELQTNAEEGRASFTGKAEDLYAFKVPQLYNLKDANFYGHGATFNSIEAVVRYKNNAMSQNPNISKDQLSEYFIPLNLSEEEIAALVDFVENGLYDPNLQRYEPAALPSGACFPNDDQVSRTDRGCN